MTEEDAGLPSFWSIRERKEPKVHMVNSLWIGVPFLELFLWSIVTGKGRNESK